MKIALVQANPRVGDIASNLERAKAAILSHRDRDLVVFPESFLTGYPADDLVLNSGFMRSVSEAVVELTDFTRSTALEWNGTGPAVLIGAPEPGAGLPFNAVHFIEPDGTRRIVRKLYLPNDGPFDERRTFAHGEERGPVSFRGYRIGIAVCEEMRNPAVCRRLAGDLADFLIVVNGSPYTRGKHGGDRLGHARRRVAETGLPMAYVNLVGGQDELVFDGGSFLMKPDGHVMRQSPFFEECTLAFTVRRDEEGRAAFLYDHASPVARRVAVHPEGQATDAADYAAATLALRDYVQKRGGSGNVVIGISGGADSALVAAMAVDALGADKVTGITMPSDVTNDVEDAVAVARALDIELLRIPIGDAVRTTREAFETALTAAGGRRKDPITDENRQARLRMVHLMAWSNDQGGLVVTTGNKSECSVGYATLYGDMAGGFNPIKDLYKTEVWRLMRYRNMGRPADWMLGPDRHCIPDAVIDKAPTAGLAENQTDEDRLGPYPVLDAFLRRLIDDQAGPEEALRRVLSEDAGEWERDPFVTRRYGHDAVQAWKRDHCTLDYARKTAKLVFAAEHKRRQSAPGPKIGPRAFGRDRRYPIINGWI